MKHIHFPTIALHFFNLILALLTIHDYPGTFLVIGTAVLLAHVVWCLISPRNLSLTHLLGCGIQVIFFTFFDVRSGAFGLGGGEFARLFYLFALAGSAVIEIGIGFYKHFRR